MNNMIKNREKIEWMNYWIEDANEKKERILLIGDSVIRQIRTKMNSMCYPKGYVVDIIAMSYNIFDDMLKKELEHFFENSLYFYKYIIFNLGFHHGSHINCKTDSSVYLQYEEKLVNVLSLIAKNCSHVIAVTGTPEKITAYSEEIFVRNNILKDVATEFGYSIVDWFDNMEKSEFRLVDRCHYTRTADEYMANQILKIIFQENRSEILNICSDLKSFNDRLNSVKRIFIYGYGIRGRTIEKYLSMHNRKIEGFIVSNKYYIEAEYIYRLENIKRSDNTLIIVTPEDYDIYQKLNSEDMEYISLLDRVYIYMEEFVEAYS